MANWERSSNFRSLKPFKLVASAILRTDIVELYVRTRCPHHGWVYEVYDPHDHKDDIHCWICRLPNQVWRVTLTQTWSDHNHNITEGGGIIWIKHIKLWYSSLHASWIKLFSMRGETWRNRRKEHFIVLNSNLQLHTTYYILRRQLLETPKSWRAESRALIHSLPVHFYCYSNR